MNVLTRNNTALIIKNIHIGLKNMHEFFIKFFFVYSAKRFAFKHSICSLTIHIVYSLVLVYFLFTLHVVTFRAKLYLSAAALLSSIDSTLQNHTYTKDRARLAPYGARSDIVSQSIGYHCQIVNNQHVYVASCLSCRMVLAVLALFTIQAK